MRWIAVILLVGCTSGMPAPAPEPISTGDAGTTQPDTGESARPMCEPNAGGAEVWCPGDRVPGCVITDECRSMGDLCNPRILNPCSPGPKCGYNADHDQWVVNCPDGTTAECVESWRCE